MKIVRKVMDVLLSLFVVLIVAVLVMYLVGIEPYITLSGSMEPAIKTGSVCFVNTKEHYSEIVEGDVISFQNASGGMVTHRVINITEEGFETKGDANDSSDGITTNRGNFRGKTLFSIPYLGYALAFIQKKAVIAMAGVVLVAMLLLSIVDMYDKKKER